LVWCQLCFDRADNCCGKAGVAPLGEPRSALRHLQSNGRFGGRRETQRVPRCPAGQPATSVAGGSGWAQTGLFGVWKATASAKVPSGTDAEAVLVSLGGLERRAASALFGAFVRSRWRPGTFG